MSCTGKELKSGAQCVGHDAREVHLDLISEFQKNSKYILFFAVVWTN